MYPRVWSVVSSTVDQVTPGLGIVAIVLILFVLREPKRGHGDGQRSATGVHGKSGLAAYLEDVWYCLRK